MKHKLKLFQCEKSIEKHIEDINIKFVPDQRVYIVKQKRKRVSIIESRIKSISLCKSIGDIQAYNWYVRYHIRGVGGVCWDDDKNIFEIKEDAYRYAEELNNRKNIKVKKIWD